MIVDEHGFVWRSTRAQTGPRGEQCVEYVCPLYPRLTRMVQRPGPDDPWNETFHVERLAQQYRTAREALAALRANP
jgi:hypothetical protein